MASGYSSARPSPRLARPAVALGKMLVSGVASPPDVRIGLALRKPAERDLARLGPNIGPMAESRVEPSSCDDVVGGRPAAAGSHGQGRPRRARPGAACRGADPARRGLRGRLRRPAPVARDHRRHDGAGGCRRRRRVHAQRRPPHAGPGGRRRAACRRPRDAGCHRRYRPAGRRRGAHGRRRGRGARSRGLQRGGRGDGAGRRRGDLS